MLRDKLMAIGLSNRESEVAAVIARGVSNKEAAGELYVTEKTIKFHLTNIYKKLSVKSRTQLIVWCAPHLSFEPVSDMKAPDDIPLVHNEKDLPSGSA